MDTQKVKDLLSELDQLVPKEGAAVLMKQYDGGPDESQIVANERGYLRLGVGLAKLAFAEKGKGGSSPDFIFLEIEYLTVPGSTIGFDWCERKNVVQDETYAVRWYDNLFPLGGLAVALIMVGLASYGLYSVLSKL